MAHVRRRRECLPASKFPVPQPDKRNVNFGEVIKTTVNGEKIYSPTRLRDGDVIKMGDYAFLYEE